MKLKKFLKKIKSLANDETKSFAKMNWRLAIIRGRDEYEEVTVDFLYDSNEGVKKSLTLNSSTENESLKDIWKKIKSVAERKHPLDYRDAIIKTLRVYPTFLGYNNLKFIPTEGAQIYLTYGDDPRTFSIDEIRVTEDEIIFYSRNNSVNFGTFRRTAPIILRVFKGNDVLEIKFRKQKCESAEVYELKKT